MNRFTDNIKKSLMILPILMILAATVTAIEVEYIGSIHEGLFAPTCIDVSNDRITILEPIIDKITAYSADGRITGSVHIKGKASGLERYSENTYIYCDRAERQIMAIDITNSSSSPLYDNRIIFNDPVDIVKMPSANYVLDAGSKEILAIDNLANISQRIALVRQQGNSIGFPSCFAFDPARERFYVLDQLTSEVWVFSAGGEYIDAFCSFGSDEGQISRGGDIACDPDGNILISDRYQGAISVFSPDGEFLTAINLYDLGQSGLGMPAGIEVDESGILYVATTESRKVHIMHLDRPADPERALAAIQAYPEDNDTLAAEGIIFIAYIDQNVVELEITGFDFQLFTEDSPETPVAEIFDLSPGVAGEDLPEANAIAAEWIPDFDLEDNKSYEWRVRARSDDLIGAWTNMSLFYITSLPTSFSLGQNYPNPFNPITHIAFDLPIETSAVMSIYDMLGKLVWSKRYDRLPPGSHKVTWDGRNDKGEPLASGVYFYRFTTEMFNETKKMVLLK